MLNFQRSRLNSRLGLMILLSSLFFLSVLIRNWASLSSHWFGYLFLAVGVALGGLLSFFDDRVLKGYYDPERQAPLITQSLVFLGLMMPTSLLIITSSASFLGGGLVFGFALNSALSLWFLRHQPEVFDRTFLSQLKRPVLAWERRALLGLVIVWVNLIWLAILR